MGHQGTGEFARISADGRFVAFESSAPNLVKGDPNGWRQVFVHDRLTGVTEQMSVTTSGEQADGGPSYLGQISRDGRFVIFNSDATNLSDAPSGGIYMRDRLKGETMLVSVSSSGEPAAGFGGFGAGLFSDDGRFIAFSTDAIDLSEPFLGPTRVYIHDRLLGTTEHVSIPISGQIPKGPCWLPSLSADGRFVVFASDASNLVPNDTNMKRDIFVRDLLIGETKRVSVSSEGEQGNDESDGALITADGRYVMFNSYASNLVATDTNVRNDGFVHDLWTGKTELVTLNWQGEQLNSPYGGVSGISDDGRLVSIGTFAINVIPEPVNGFSAVYVRARWKLGDVNRDGIVNVVDLLAIINAWGPCPAAPPPPALPIPCDADVTNDNLVNVADLLLIINNWG